MLNLDPKRKREWKSVERYIRMEDLNSQLSSSGICHATDGKRTWDMRSAHVTLALAELEKAIAL